MEGSRGVPHAFARDRAGVPPFAADPFSLATSARSRARSRTSATLEEARLLERKSRPASLLSTGVSLAPLLRSKGAFGSMARTRASASARRDTPPPLASTFRQNPEGASRRSLGPDGAPGGQRR